MRAEPAPPKFATPRTPGLASYGPAIGAVAAGMGTPLMPWQELTAGVLGEVYADGRFRHPVVVITVPRQSGKTTLVLAKSVHRCLYLPDRRVWYTAETGKKARDKWGEMVDTLTAEGSPLRGLIKGKPKRGNGHEELKWVNGSWLNPFPPTRDGLHSKQADLVDLDEGWAHSPEDGAAILAGAIPTMATRPFRQLVILSTMGDAASTWFHNLVDSAKGLGDQVDGLDQPPALLEWGVPEGTDADDLETIAHWHPAFGYTIDLQALKDARAQLIAANGVELGKAEFLRAYGNLRSGARTPTFPAALWSRAAWTLDEDRATPLARPAAFGVAVAEDGEDAAIFAAWPVGVDQVLVDLVDHRAGTSWVVPELTRLRLRHGLIPTYGDRGGPAGPVLDEWERTERSRLRQPTAEVLAKFTRADYAAACADMRNRVLDQDGAHWRWRLTLLPDHVEGDDDVLTAAQKLANRRFIGDGVWVWGRRASAGSIAALEAATCAGWGALHAPRGQRKPLLSAY